MSANNSSTDMSMLKEMGFSEINIEKAVIATGTKDIQSLMEWLLTHSDQGNSGVECSRNNTTESMVVSDSENDTASTSEDTATTNEPQSIKCDVCGKLFRTYDELEMHATKTGHDKFSESNEEKKPLTEAEKKKQLQLLEEILKQKRKEREEKEEGERLEKEKNRIRSGKEVTQARKKLEELQMKKLFDQRKREKEEDRLIHQKIKEQIKADKIARRNNSTTINNTVNNSSISPMTSMKSSDSANKVDYNETKLQIRLTNGQTIIQKFSSKEQLSSVRLYIEMNRTDATGPFTLMTNFPKRIFTDNDFETPLDALGLVPSAVIIVQKKTSDDVN